MNKIKIDKLLEDYNKKNSSGASLLILEYDKILYKKCYGLANINKKEKVKPQTNFRLASVSKQFTAAGILFLIEKGNLKFTTKLTEVFSDFPNYGKEITIKHLLTHTSGLLDYEDLIKNNKNVRDEDVLKLIKKQKKIYFKPGTKFKYSNGGYCLLALIIEKLSKKSFASFLKKEIFNRFGMKKTVVNDEGKTKIPNRAYGYSRKGKSFIKTDQNHTSRTQGDGGIYSSIDDLFKWSRALDKNKILKKALKKQRLSNRKEINYGFGWWFKKYRNLKVIYHEGESIGFRTIIYKIPSKKLTIIFLSNRNEGDTMKITERILEDCK